MEGFESAILQNAFLSRGKVWKFQKFGKRL